MCMVLPAAAAAAGAAGTAAASTAALTTMSYLSLGTTVLGGALSLYGQMQQSKAQQQQYEYQAAISRNNQIISQRQADDAISRGQVAEEEHRLKVNQLKASQRAAFASNGIDLGSDVVGETLSDTAMLGELDALTIRSNAEREAYGYLVQASNYGAEAGGSLLASKNAARAGGINAASSLLGTANKFSNKYIDLKYRGAF